LIPKLILRTCAACLLDESVVTTSVLLVCLGNICRSPTAHAVLQQRVNAQGMQHSIFIDSAGTGGWHAGKAPDARATAAATRRGYDLSALWARQVAADDFAAFDIILAMDHDNLSQLQALAPADFGGSLGLLLDYHPQARGQAVPDPYYGGGDGFEQVLDLVEAAVEGLLDAISQRP
jgi:protein-tyrosine phosphatase